MNVDVNIINAFLGLGAAAVVAMGGFFIGLVRQVSALAATVTMLTANVETVAGNQLRDRDERINSEERIHERIDTIQHRPRGARQQ